MFIETFCDDLDSCFILNIHYFVINSLVFLPCLPLLAAICQLSITAIPHSISATNLLLLISWVWEITSVDLVCHFCSWLQFPLLSVKLLDWLIFRGFLLDKYQKWVDSEVHTQPFPLEFGALVLAEFLRWHHFVLFFWLFRVTVGVIYCKGRSHSCSLLNCKGNFGKTLFFYELIGSSLRIPTYKLYETNTLCNEWYDNDKPS